MLTLIIFKCGVVKKKLLVWVWTLLLIHNLLISGSGKRACFRSKYCYLGAPIGTPGLPDGWYVAPDLGWGGLRQENVSNDNIERVLLILTKCDKWENQKIPQFQDHICPFITSKQIGLETRGLNHTVEENKAVYTTASVTCRWAISKQLFIC